MQCIALILTISMRQRKTDNLLLLGKNSSLPKEKPNQISFMIGLPFCLKRELYSIVTHNRPLVLTSPRVASVCPLLSVTVLHSLLPYPVDRTHGSSESQWLSKVNSQTLPQPCSWQNYSQKPKGRNNPRVHQWMNG